MPDQVRYCSNVLGLVESTAGNAVRGRELSGREKKVKMRERNPSYIHHVASDICVINVCDCDTVANSFITEVAEERKINDDNATISSITNVAEEENVTNNCLLLSQASVHNAESNVDGINDVINLPSVHDAGDETNDYINKVLLAFQNVEGLNKSKIVDLEEFFTTFQPTVLAISEHWCRFDCDVPKIYPYKLWSKCRVHAKRGGVTIWVREDKVGKTFTLPAPMDKEHLMQDQIWIQVPANKLSLAAVYIPPGEQCIREEQLHLLLDFISISQKLGLRPIILGDLNVHDVHVVDANIQNPQMRL